MTIKKKRNGTFSIKNLTWHEMKAIEYGLHCAWMNFLDSKINWEENEGILKLQYYTEKIQESYYLHQKFAEETNLG